jgi:hypothetical protein
MISYLSYRFLDRERKNAHGERGMRSLMDIRRSSMSAVSHGECEPSSFVCKLPPLRTDELAESIDVGVLVGGR